MFVDTEAVTFILILLKIWGIHCQFRSIDSVTGDKPFEQRNDDLKLCQHEGVLDWVSSSSGSHIKHFGY